MTVHVEPSVEPVTLAQWRELPEETRCELVDGVLVMSPHELSDNRVAAGELAHLLRRALPRMRTLQDMDLLLSTTPRSTIRVPDLLLVPADAPRGVHEFTPDVVTLVAEVLSPSSREVDWVHKRSEYARAGIATYLVIDLENDTLTAFTEPADAWYGHAINGTQITVDVDGTSVTIDVADLR